MNDMNKRAARPPRRIGPIFIMMLIVILAFTLGPLISVMMAGVIGDASGCMVDEGGVHACLVGGFDIGETLYTMTVLGWLMFVTLPLGGLAFLVWLISLIVTIFVRRRAASRSTA